MHQTYGGLLLCYYKENETNTIKLDVTINFYKIKHVHHYIVNTETTKHVILFI